MNRRNIIIIGSGLFILILITTIISLNNSVKATSSSPAEGSTTFKAYEDVAIVFNRPLAASTAKNVSILPKETGITTINDSKLTFHAAGGFQAGKLYTLTVTKPTDTSGKVGKTFTLHFTPVFVPFNQLPIIEQKNQIAETDKVQSDYPFTANLPHSEFNYSVKFKFDAKDQIVYLVTLNVVSLGANDTTYIPALKSAKAEADTWIRSVGFDPAVLKPIYNPDPNTGVYTPDSK